MSLGVLGAVLAPARSGAADRFNVPESCGTEAEFTRELERLLGAQAEQARPASLTIVGPDATGAFTLRLELARELRELRDEDCRTLFRSAVVVTAASYQRDHVEPEVVTAPPERAALPKQAMSAWHGELAAGAGVAGGLVPGVAPAFELSAAATWDAFRFGLALRYLTPRETVQSDGDGVSVSGLGGRVTAGIELGRYVAVSAGVAVYRLDGRGLGVDVPSSDVVWAPAPVLELTGIPLRLEQLRLEVGVEGQWMLSRPRFVIEGIDGPRELYRVPRVGGAAVFRAVWRFL